MSVVELSYPGIFLSASPAFAKPGNGKALGHSKGGGNGNGNGNGNGGGGGNGNGAGGGNGGDDEGGGGGGDPSGGGDFHDEGFVPRKNSDIAVPRGKDKDSDGERDVIGGKSKDHHLHDGLGFKDKLDFKFLKKGGGDAEEYLKLLDTGSVAAGKGGDAAEDDPSGFQAGGVLGAEKNGGNAEKSFKADDKQEKGEAKAERKEEKDVEKAERKAEKAAEKEARKAEKAARKAERKGETVEGVAQSIAAAEAALARDRAGNTELLPVRTASYASREVLALGLSPAADERVRALGFEISASSVEYGGTTLRTLFVPERMDALEALRLLRKELPGESFQLNRLYRPYRPSENDAMDKEPWPDSGPGGRNCLGDKCYSRAAIQWRDSLATCAPNISIGVIDTDIDSRHPTFAGRKISQKTFVPEDKKRGPNWHGTGILALLAGRPDSGTPGLIPEANFYVANSFFADDNGEAITDTVSLLRALEWMTASGAKVVNMSFAGPDDVLVQGRIKGMRAEGFVFAAAAGNEGPAAAPTYPAAYPEVIAVTAVAKNLRVYPFANRGSYIDLAAPGVRIWTALPNGREGYRTGTSFATPFATAVLALQRPDIMDEPEAELLDHLSTVPLGSGEDNTVYGRGLLQAPRECPGSGAMAVNKAQPPSR